MPYGGGQCSPSYQLSAVGHTSSWVYSNQSIEKWQIVPHARVRVFLTAEGTLGCARNRATGAGPVIYIDKYEYGSRTWDAPVPLKILSSLPSYFRFLSWFSSWYSIGPGCSFFQAVGRQGDDDVDKSDGQRQVKGSSELTRPWDRRRRQVPLITLPQRRFVILAGSICTCHSPVAAVMAPNLELQTVGNWNPKSRETPAACASISASSC